METILITGANRGIGLQLCKHFLDAGWNVIASCRDPSSAHALTALASEHLRIFPLEVSDPVSIANLVAELKDQAIDVLINNAGIIGGDHQSLTDMDYEAWLHAFKVNTMAPLRIAAAVLPLLKLSRHPRIVSISSQMGAFGLDMGPGRIIYSSSKTALSKVMQLLAKELQPDNIIVCPVHPGWVQTDMGGANAAISVEECATDLYKLICGLQMQHSGRFWSWDGTEHVW